MWLHFFFVESSECTPAKLQDVHEVQMAAYAAGDRGMEEGNKKCEKATTRLRNYVVINKAQEERRYGLQLRLCPSCLHSTQNAFTYCLTRDGYFISRRESFLFPESARQNMSAQEAAEEVEVDELKRIAKEAAEKAKDDEDGEELRKQPKPKGDVVNPARPSRTTMTNWEHCPGRNVNPGSRDTGPLSGLGSLCPTSIDTGGQKTRRVTRKQWKVRAKGAKFLPADETRNGLHAEDLPQTFHDTTIEEYVDMKGGIHLMGFFCLELGDVWERQCLEEPQGIEGCCYGSVTTSRSRTWRWPGLAHHAPITSLHVTRQRLDRHEQYHEERMTTELFGSQKAPVIPWRIGAEEIADTPVGADGLKAVPHRILQLTDADDIITSLCVRQAATGVLAETHSHQAVSGLKLCCICTQ